MVIPVRKRILSLLANPFMLAAIPSVILFASLPVMHRPYLLSLESSTKVPDNYYSSYCDLNGDGISEMITAFDYPNGSGITVTQGATILNQWNIKGTFNFSEKSTLYIPADCNGDGVMELYLFSLKSDSIFLHSVRNPFDVDMALRNRLIDITGQGNGVPDPRIVPAEPMDLNGDGRVELLFGITAGFSRHPRKVYAYYPDNDSLVSSPPIGGFILGIIPADLDNDSLTEIIPYGYASGNIDSAELKHHDQSAWLTVLDRNLGFMFDPVEFRGNFTLALPMALNQGKGGMNDILVSSHETDSTASIVSFTPSGDIVQRTTIPVKPYAGFMTVNRKNEPVYAVAERDRGVVLFDSEKKYLREIEFSGAPMFFQKDVDLDGKAEIIALCNDTGRLQVYRPGLLNPAEADIDIGFDSNLNLSVIRKTGESPRIFLESGTRRFILEYYRNPLYYPTFAIYPLIYAAFLAFVVLVQQSQKRLLIRREEEKKKISELQLALIRNQLDPHFTLNALNSVLYLVEQSDREKARDSLQRFSGLYRELLLSAGKSRRSLVEEIDFCREYLELEKIRYMNRFGFEFYIQPDINEELPVPKLVLQLFAENSVKHGLAGRESGGVLEVRVTGNGNELTISIRDNGVGRARSAGDGHGATGKGMALMNELFDLCNRYYEDKHSFTVTDQTDDDGQPAGTRVTVSIRYRNEVVIVS